MVVYWMRAGNTEHVKVGFSKYPLERLEKLQTGNPYPLKVIRQVEGDFALEQALRVHYRDKHFRAEWFCLTDDDIWIDLGTVSRERKKGDLPPRDLPRDEEGLILRKERQRRGLEQVQQHLARKRQSNTRVDTEITGAQTTESVLDVEARLRSNLDKLEHSEPRVGEFAEVLNDIALLYKAKRAA